MPKQLVQKPMQSFVCINDAHGSNPKKKCFEYSHENHDRFLCDIPTTNECI